MLVRPIVRIRHFFSLFFVLSVSISFLAACGQQSSTNTGSPIKIGISLSKTGDFASDAAQLGDGYTAWSKEVNAKGGLLGRQVQLDIADDGGDPAKTRANYTTFITGHHDDLVLGPIAIPQTKAGSQVAHQYGYAYIFGVGSAAPVFEQNLPNIFSVSLSVKDALNPFAYYMLSLPKSGSSARPTTVAYASVDDPFAGAQVDNVKGIFDKNGVTSLYDKKYPQETTDFSTYAQAIINTNADIVVLGTEAVGECVQYVQIFKQQHHNFKALTCTAGPDAGPAFTGPLGGPGTAEGIIVPNGGWYPGLKSYQSDTFVSEFSKDYNTKEADISSTASQGFAAGQVLEQAINKTQSIDNAKLIAALHANVFDSVLGPVHFTPSGENDKASAYLFQWENGKLIPVYPSSQAAANPQYPKRDWQ